LFAFAALVPWTFFVQGLSQSADSLVGNGNLIKKIYFPRLAMPLSTVSAGLLDLSISFSVLLILMFWFGVHPTLRILWLPLFVVLAFCTSLGAGFWLSAMNVRFRDVKHAVPFLTQFWMYATPIAYPSSLLHQPWKTLYGLNPMAGVVEGFRWALLGTKTAAGPMLAVSALVSVLMLVGGAYYFRRMEKSFADVV
jgi:lipopolysaccharide transport system permease protein